MIAHRIVIAALLVWCLPARGEEALQTHPIDEMPAAVASAPPSPNTREALCLMIEAAARANGLPLEFFARVIWQESRFNSAAVGPMTRFGTRAQGIAQFMPGTAAERSLLDPFDPVQALPKSAEFLAELRRRFGNLGLAAAAYNAGPQRVQDWLAGSRTIPGETRNYVSAITGLTIDDWAAGGLVHAYRPHSLGCRELMALLRRAPNPFVAALSERVELGAVAPWGVQLSGNFSRERALASYARVARQYAGVLAGQDPSILVAKASGLRPFYQVRVGAQTRAEADNLCTRIIRLRGACLVLRNRV